MPDQSERDEHALDLRDDLRRSAGVAGGEIGGRVVDDAGAAERRVDEDAGAERADDAADAVDAEDVEAVVVADARSSARSRRRSSRRRRRRRARSRPSGRRSRRPA